MTDMFILLLLPGGGDQLQGIKRGIMELADLILINKADDDTEVLAGQSAAEYRNALQLLRPRSPGWTVEVQTCSARDNKGIAEAWDVVVRHQEALAASGLLTSRRADQARAWMWSEVKDNLMADLAGDSQVRRQVAELEAAASEGRVSAVAAADRLLRIYRRDEENDNE